MDRETAVRYLTIKVAHIIYDTVECSLEDRAGADWHAAEHIVNNHFNWMVGRMVGQHVEGDTHASVWKWELDDTCTYEQFETKLGVYVWKNVQSYRSELPHPPYGKITFS